MKPRFDMETIFPEAYSAMLALEGTVRKSGLSANHRHLIKLRASMINGCAFCVEMHAVEARKQGLTESKIYALTAWKESPLFSDEERALLAMTDEVTLIAGNGLTEGTYDKLKDFFSEETISHAIMQAITINAWNRVAVTSHMVHAYQVKETASAL